MPARRVSAILLSIMPKRPLSPDEKIAREPVPSAEGANARTLSEADLDKVQALIDAGSVPPTFLALYHEIAGTDGKTSFLDAYRAASPERQKKILQAVERMSRDIEMLVPASADKSLLYTLINILSLVYLALLMRTSSSITADKDLDPGKNHEGATLRILELNGEEVFTDPGKFGITDPTAFYVDLVRQGHAREVLDHVRVIPADAHARIIAESLKVSRSKKGNVERLHVLDALPHARQLDLEVAKQLSKDKMYAVMLDHLASFKESVVQEILVYLMKRKELSATQVLRAVLSHPHALLGDHLVTTLAFLEPKLLRKLELEGDEDALEGIRERLPNLKDELQILRDMEAGILGEADSLRFIPTKKVLEKMLRTRPVAQGLTLPNVRFLTEEAFKMMHGFGYRRVNFPRLEELDGGAAPWVIHLPGSVGLSSDTAMSAEARQAFSEYRGWLVAGESFVRGSDEGLKEFIASGDDVFLENVTEVSVASAKLLSERRPQSVLYLPRVRSVPDDVAEALQLGRPTNWIALHGLAGPTPDAPWGAGVCDLVLNSYQLNGERTRLNALRGLRLLSGGESSERSLVLSEVNELSVAAAKEARAFRELIMWGPAQLAPEAAVELSRGHLTSLEWRGAASMPSDVAEPLGTLVRLSLEGLESLDADSAAALNRIDTLCFRGLRQLSVPAAVNLARGDGDLYLDAAGLDTEVIEALAEHKGRLCLRDMRLQTIDIAEILFQKRGWYPGTGISSDRKADEVDLAPETVARLSKPFVERLLAKSGTLHLDGLTDDVDQECLAMLAGYKGGDISFGALTHMNDTVANTFANFSGVIMFRWDFWMYQDGMRAMRPYFERIEREHGGRGLSETVILSLERERKRIRENLENEMWSMGPASSLADINEVKRSKLDLSNVHEMSLETMRRLMDLMGFSADLKIGLKTVSDDMAKLLSSFTGRIELSQLTSVSVEAFALFVGNAETVSFPRLNEISQDMMDQVISAYTQSQQKYSSILLPGVPKHIFSRTYEWSLNRWQAQSKRLKQAESENGACYQYFDKPVFHIGRKTFLTGP